MFNWDENRIDNHYLIFFSNKPKIQLRKICEDLITSMRITLAVVEGKHLNGLQRVNNNFSPRGYSNKSVDDATKNIHKLMKTKATLYLKSSEVMACEGPLVSKKIFYSK